MATDLASFVSTQLSENGYSIDDEMFEEYHAEIMDVLAQYHIDTLGDEDEDKDNRGTAQLFVKFHSAGTAQGHPEREFSAAVKKYMSIMSTMEGAVTQAIYGWADDHEEELDDFVESIQSGEVRDEITLDDALEEDRRADAERAFSEQLHAVASQFAGNLHTFEGMLNVLTENQQGLPAGLREHMESVPLNSSEDDDEESESSEEAEEADDNAAAA